MFQRIGLEEEDGFVDDVDDCRNDGECGGGVLTPMFLPLKLSIVLLKDDNR